MKWTLCTIAFRDEDVRGIIKQAAEAGYDEVEIIGKQVDGKTDAELDAIRDCAEEAGIVISGLSPYFWLTQDEKLLQESMEIAERFIAMSRRLGARMIRTFTDAGPTGIGSDVATDAHWEVAVESLKKITAMAPELIFAVETHHLTLADTPETTERLLSKVGAENLLLTYQPFDHGAIVDDFLRLKPHVRQVHLNPQIGATPEGGLIGCGIDYASLVRTLGTSGYEHSCAVEFCKPGDATWDKIRDALTWCKQLAGEA